MLELSLEACRQIIKHIGSRADICSLCRVCKSFQYVAERALYNTLYMRKPSVTISLCDTLARQPRLSAIVEALTIYLYEEEEEEHEEEEEEEEGENPGTADSAQSPLPEAYWPSISRALRSTKRLLYLNIHINNSENTSAAWILNNCTFRLRSFHCDLEWDKDLISFLNNQHSLADLYIVDYNDLGTNTPTAVSPSPSNHIDTTSLPNLSTLECTFTEAAAALVPGRPVTHLKTCFSASEITEKRAELSSLFSKIPLSARPFRALDIADSSYTEEFCMELLRTIAHSLPASDLHYLGTLVLPIGGRQRLQFYGLLRRIPRLECLEVDVSEWVPSPTLQPVALRALASELRLYCPTVTRVVFVHEYERFVITIVDGFCKFDSDINTESLWRDT